MISINRRFDSLSKLSAPPQTFEKWRQNPRGEVLSGWSPEQSPGEFSTFYCHKVLTIRRISGQRSQHRVNGDIIRTSPKSASPRWLWTAYDRRHSSYDQSGVSKFAYGCRNSNHNRKKQQMWYESHKSPFARDHDLVLRPFQNWRREFANTIRPKIMTVEH